MTLRIFPSVLVAFVFLVANGVSLLAILAQNRRTGSSSSDRTSGRGSRAAGADPTVQEEKVLAPAEILGWEFEYARVTASEAMAERHTMVNFYLLVAGVVTSGVVAVLGQGADLPKSIGTVLLWLLCGIGWLYFLGIIRLRQAWCESARAMSQIKEFYIQHAKELDSEELRSAFRWQAHSLPAPDKPWTVFFYAAMLISLLDSAAYVAGGALIDLTAVRSSPLLILGPLVLFGLAYFAFHVWLYSAFLKPR